MQMTIRAKLINDGFLFHLFVCSFICDAAIGSFCADFWSELVPYLLFRLS